VAAAKNQSAPPCDANKQSQGPGRAERAYTRAAGGWQLHWWRVHRW